MYPFHVRLPSSLHRNGAFAFAADGQYACRAMTCPIVGVGIENNTDAVGEEGLSGWLEGSCASENKLERPDLYNSSEMAPLRFFLPL